MFLACEVAAIVDHEEIGVRHSLRGELHLLHSSDAVLLAADKQRRALDVDEMIPMVRAVSDARAWRSATSGPARSTMARISFTSAS